MAGKEASLEERLKLGFDCSELCSLEQRHAELCIAKGRGTDAFLREDYNDARWHFLNAIGKADSAGEKEGLYNKVIECSKELFAIHKNESEFKKICAGYEHMIKAFETSDNYLSYMKFLGEDMSNMYNLNMFNEAIHVGETAESRFPEDYRIHTEMHTLYGFTEQYVKAYDSLVKVVALKFDDPDFLLHEFGKVLWYTKEGQGDASTIPFNIILKRKGGAILHDAVALQKYGRYALYNIENNDRLAVYLLYRAHELRPLLPGLKEDLASAFDNVCDDLREQGKKEEFKEFARTYGKVFKIKKELAEEGEEKEEKAPLAEKSKYSKEVVVVNPKEIKQYLDQYVIGQEQAKKDVAVGYFTHLLRLKNAGEKGENIEKSNILLLGPTGCGKTYMLQILAQMSKVPFVVIDTSKVTSAGYVGGKAEQCLSSLLAAAGGDMELAQSGIVYLDEADKIKSNPGIGKDVGGEGAQQQYLKLLEGSVVNVPIGEHKTVSMDTTNILFVVGGAFSYTKDGGSLSEQMKTRHRKIGFRMSSDEEDMQEKKKVITELTDKDLQEYGFLPEFVGRLHFRIVLDKLTKQELRKILTDRKNSVLRQYEVIFQKSGIKLDVREEALDLIAEKAFEKDSGARSLKTICDRIFVEALYELPSSSIKQYIVDRKEVLRYV